MKINYRKKSGDKKKKKVYGRDRRKDGKCPWAIWWPNRQKSKSGMEEQKRKNNMWL